MQIRAALVQAQGAPLTIETLELGEPAAGEVLVEVHAAGVCHSDLHAIRGDWPMRVPLVAGHEGAGIVRQIGAGVTRVQVGDHVVLCWAPACGACPACLGGAPTLCDRLERTTFRNRLPFGGTRLTWAGQNVAAFLGTACFATHTVVPEEAVVPVATDIPFTALAAVGCAVVTGVGAVTNAVRLPPGAVVAVIGAGGVGLNVVQGAVLAQASRVIAIDRRHGPLDIARRLGATDVLVADGATAEAIRTLTGGRGADVVVDTVGTPTTLNDALGVARKGGTVVLTGLSRIDAQGTIAMYRFVMQEKRLIGSAYGSGQPLQDIARLVDLYRQRRLKLDEVAARTYPLTGINAALDALERAEGGRGVILPLSSAVGESAVS
jgi:S-(hydroxymethyl)glutathione dehydrogenase / alcohol dehydrogenase